MLKSLRIKNYAIINDLSIEFEDGFNVFTGETGAGKSIIVGALTLLLKGRSDSSLIKEGSDKAIIEGVFSIDDPDLKKELDDNDIEYDDDLIVKRVISRDNKNSIKINQSSVTLNYLSELLSKYVDIHSQKDSQYLFVKANQLDLLDKYASNGDLLDEYHSLYKKYLDVKKEYDELLNNTYNEREIEFYKFDYDELNNANLSLNEEEKLESLEKRLKESEKYLNVLNTAISIYDEDSGLKEHFYNLINSLSINDDRISKIKDDIDSLYYSLEDKIDELKNILNEFNNEDLNLDKIEERLFIYAKLKRKHKTDVEGLVKLKDDLKAKIALFNDRDIVLAEKQKEVDSAYKNAYNLALKISDNRKGKAKQLENEIMNEVKDLLLNNCAFNIQINECELNSNGMDDVEFYVSMNKGESLKPLKNAASGGEISRLMLALKVAFSKVSKTDLLILDEIDTGVSGKVALLMGEKIAKIAKNCQVLCITHLAPVAACAKAHFYIYKEDDNNQTATKIKQLSHDEIIHELASISSTLVNENALKTANDLYENAQKVVK